MCGIVGYIGNNEAVSYLLSGLQKLEYRGYDSCGIALKKDKIKIFKSVGKIKNLTNLIDENQRSNIGIGHTRWATHGIPNVSNCHPHISYQKNFVLVHNGIIENYQEIKNKYLKDIPLYSSTDTEVIVNLIEVLYQDNVLSTLKEIKKIIKGSYALVIIHHQEDKLYFMKNQTPLTIGHNLDEFFLSSDSISFPSFINQQIILDDGDYGYVDYTSINIYDSNNDKKDIVYKDIIRDEELINQKTFSHHMEKEIHDQPLMIDKLIKLYFNGDKLNIPTSIINNIHSSNTIYLVGCGSSYYSANMGKYFLEKYLHKQVQVILASEAIYQLPLLSKNPYFIFLSQSGETLDVINLIKQIKKLNIKTLAITNSINSSITHLCDESLFIQAGREISVASTKAFLGQTLLLLILANNNCKNDLINLKKEIINLLDNLDIIKQISKTLTNYKDVFYLGRNIDYNIALEASLKLKEISYIHAEAFPAGELKHGTLALIDNNVAVISLISQENISSIMRTNIMETSSRGAKTIVISSNNVSHNSDDLTLNYINEDLSPLLILVSTQLIAYYTSLYKGNEIDTPRNLAKSVTVE